MLFLNCEDLMSLIATVANGDAIKFPSLDTHVCNASQATTARNILLLDIICSNNFDPDDAADLDYFWDLVYNATWPESTQIRFTEHIEKLQYYSLVSNISIPKSFYQEMRLIFTGWLTMMESLSVEHVLANRYV